MVYIFERKNIEPSWSVPLLGNKFFALRLDISPAYLGRWRLPSHLWVNRWLGELFQHTSESKQNRPLGLFLLLLSNLSPVDRLYCESKNKREDEQPADGAWDIGCETWGMGRGNWTWNIMRDVVVGRVACDVERIRCGAWEMNRGAWGVGHMAWGVGRGVYIGREAWDIPLFTTRLLSSTRYDPRQDVYLSLPKVNMISLLITLGVS